MAIYEIIDVSGIPLVVGCVGGSRELAEKERKRLQRHYHGRPLIIVDEAKKWGDCIVDEAKEPPKEG